MTSVILCNISDVNKVIEEEKNFWVQDVLLDLGVSEDVIASAENIDEYLHFMNQLGIEVEYRTTGEVLIYKKTMYRGEDGEEVDWLNPSEENLVAQWKPPTLVKKVEGKNVHYEVHLNEWSSFKMRL